MSVGVWRWRNREKKVKKHCKNYETVLSQLKCQVGRSGKYVRSCFPNCQVSRSSLVGTWRSLQFLVVLHHLKKEWILFTLKWACNGFLHLWTSNMSIDMGRCIVHWRRSQKMSTTEPTVLLFSWGFIRHVWCSEWSCLIGWYSVFHKNNQLNLCSTNDMDSQLRCHRLFPQPLYGSGEWETSGRQNLPNSWRSKTSDWLDGEAVDLQAVRRFLVPVHQQGV